MRERRMNTNASSSLLPDTRADVLPSHINNVLLINSMRSSRKVALRS